MLHSLQPSLAILEALTQAVRVQFRLLSYAAHYGVFDEPACASFVDADPALVGRGADAARWVTRSRTLRLKHLNDFGAHPDVAERHNWSTRLSGEAFALLKGVPDALTPVAADAPGWQQSGAEFLRQFYEALSSSSGLPGPLLGRAPKEPFDRQRFLRAFQDANRSLYVCAVCDEGRIGTRRRGKIYTDIDHFFPQSLYPHLSIHPYNLVPICHACNSWIKHDTDPLQDGAVRVLPGDLVLPYHGSGIAEKTLLGVNLDAWRRSGAPFALRPRPKGAGQSQMDGLARVAGIPERWNDPATVHEIGETLFRRLSQFVRARPGLLERDDDGDLLPRKLTEFLGILRDENLGRDPLSFPMQWLLAHLTHDAPAPGSPSDSMLQEVREWIVPPASEAERVRRGAELQRLLRADPEE